MRRPFLSALIAGFLGVAAAAPTRTRADDAVPGVRPTSADGKPLNLDFETGTLKDWKAEGEAFAGQPIKGDTVFPRRNDNRSEHAGEYWIGGYEKLGDRPQGTLTSVPFEVKHPFASFLVGGGPHKETCVEVRLKEGDQLVLRASGDEAENMRRVVVDLRSHVGKQIYVRLVDQHSGHWGHVNFDDFLFHETRPAIAASSPRRAADLQLFAGLTPAQAAAQMTLPEGFTVTAFAGEPDVLQPIAMTIDERGRLWVAEAFSYPMKRPAGEGKDRILIFEDFNGDGRFDKRTVFAEGLNLVSGIEVGFGGVFVGQAPELLFIPDRNRDDKPDGPPEILLDGWGYEDTHETLNSFIWGPDGWLYGCHGVFTHSRVGKPGVPDNQRVRINAGIWRYHPVTRQFEVFAEGTSNPWGVDFNDYGDAFLTCCVIPHLFHVIPGARYQRQAGQHFNPYTYADIQTIAKHRHWVGNQWNDADRAKSDASGGGHAHAGAMIYLGGHWPAEYRNQLFMNNIHGARLNLDRLERHGSGYVGDAAPDFCKTNDSWSQILYLRYGPNGDVFMIDWYDNNQCHHGNDAGHDRSNGRIFTIRYRNPNNVRVDLARQTDAELIEDQLRPNDFFSRTARRILQERAAEGKLAADTKAKLVEMARTHADETRRLRAWWCLHAANLLDESLVQQMLSASGESERAWGARFAVAGGPAAPRVVAKLVSLAKSDGSAAVRLALASAAQKLDPAARTSLLKPLLSHAEDEADHNLPLMYWYAAEPLAGHDPDRALALALEGQIGLVRGFMVRRVAAEGTAEALAAVVRRLDPAGETGRQLELLRGLRQGLTGRRQVPQPRGWAEVSKALRSHKDAEIRGHAMALAVTFGDRAALAELRDRLADENVAAGERREALAALLAARDPGLAPVLLKLLDAPELRRDALRGLAAYDANEIPARILAGYDRFSAEEKRDALATLCSRAASAQKLLDAIEKKTIASADLTADLVRNLRNLKDDALNARIEKVWGVLNDTPEEKARLIAHYKALLQRAPESEPDVALGRALFTKTCSQCHTLFGVGEKVGPELTGSNRGNLDYLLSNVLDPSAVVGKDYLPLIIQTTGGQVLTGLVKAEDKTSLTLVTATETVVVPIAEIEERRVSTASMMPDDLLKTMSEDEVRSLVAYLASPTQTPVLATPETLKLFWNETDLTGWTGNTDLWRVENGEIVGTSPGLTRNEFLKSQLETGDFRLTLEVKLTPNSENSGIQFRSAALANGDVKGYQADIGQGWWGKLYEEHGRALIWDKSGEAHVKPGEWNRYEIEAQGSRIRTKINGQLCVDLDDPEGARRGLFALQLHSGGALEVRFRKLKLELLEPPPSAPPAGGK